MNTPLILLTDETGVGAALPLSLEGAPSKNDAGETIHYRRIRVVPKPPTGKQWVDVKDGALLDMKRSRMDEWIRNTNALIAGGRKPFVSKRHVFSTPDPADTLGIVERLERDNDELYAVVGLHGDDSLIIAARNGRSIGVAGKDALDATGNAYDGEWLHHLAILPNPALPGLERFAASADHAPTAHVFALSTSGLAPERSPIMKPETITKLRAKLNLPDAKAVPDEEIAERAAVLALADPPADRTAEVTALSADKTRLETELTAAKAESQRVALELSAAKPKEYDPLSLSLINESFATKREQAIASGSISEAGAKLIDALLIPGGKPSGVALSLSGDGIAARPLYARLFEIIAANQGVKINNGVTRATSILALDAGSKLTPEQLQAAVDAEMKNTELGRRSLAARKAS